MKKLISLAVLFFAALSAQAAIVQGDFRTESDLPYCCDRSGPLVYQNLNAAVGAGQELTSANFLENPSGWGGGVVHMDLDPLSNVLTLLSQDTWDFETFLATITNIQFSAGEIITGISLLSNNLTDRGIVPMLGFTADSISINYDAQTVFNFTGGTAQFQIVTSQVPEPASLALLGLGLAGFAFMRRRKQV